MSHRVSSRDRKRATAVSPIFPIMMAEQIARKIMCSCSAEGDDHVTLSFKVSHVSTSCKAEYIENRDQPYITISVIESQFV